MCVDMVSLHVAIVSCTEKCSVFKECFAVWRLTSCELLLKLKYRTISNIGAAPIQAPPRAYIPYFFSIPIARPLGIGINLDGA